jgi:hypothetical protein
LEQFVMNTSLFHWPGKPRNHECFEFDATVWGYRRGPSIAALVWLF